MKAITILQPWATLIACGAKRFETRSWRPDCYGPIAIHAGRTRLSGFAVLFEAPPFAELLRAAGFSRVGDLPVGAILATARIAAIHRAEVIANTLRGQGNETELELGDFRPGRWAWELADVRRLPEPIPAKGKLHVWEWGPPAPLTEKE